MKLSGVFFIMEIEVAFFTTLTVTFFTNPTAKMFQCIAAKLGKYEKTTKRSVLGWFAAGLPIAIITLFGVRQHVKNSYCC